MRHSVTPSLDTLLVQENKTNIPAKKAKWHLGTLVSDSKMVWHTSFVVKNYSCSAFNSLKNFGLFHRNSLTEQSTGHHERGLPCNETAGICKFSIARAFTAWYHYINRWVHSQNLQFLSSRAITHANILWYHMNHTGLTALLLQLS